jgi:hypothetical protein
MYLHLSHGLLQYQVPQELFILQWHEHKVCNPKASDERQDQANNITTILIEMNEHMVCDDDVVHAFGQHQATQELAFQNEAVYSVSA